MSRLLPWLIVLSACPAPQRLPVDPDPMDTDAAATAFGDLPEGTWSYLPVEGMKCGNGAGTGVGVNPGAAPDKAVIVVQGGGACWDGATCYVLETASYVQSGWGEAQLASEVRLLDASPLFDRSNDDNPWADATWIFVPYCTGDLHIGRAEGRYDPLQPERVLHHAGDANLTAALEVATAALPEVDQLWALGFSAGGYGVQFQADRFVNAWPDARVALLADGSPMVHPYDGRWGLWRTAWNARLPDDCEDCLTSVPTVLSKRAAAAPDARFGLITTRSDNVLTLFLNYPVGRLAPAVDRLVSEQYAEDDHLNAWVVDGNDHVLLGNLDRTTPDGVRLGDWVEGWRDGADGWGDAR